MTEARNVDTNVQVTLAIQRTYLALERTQLAWVRTNFAVLSAGFALDKGIEALFEAKLLTDSNWLVGGHFAGVLLAFVASLTLLWATSQYLIQVRAIGGTSARITTSPALVLSGFVSLLGIVVALGMLLWT